MPGTPAAKPRKRAPAAVPKGAPAAVRPLETKAAVPEAAGKPESAPAEPIWLVRIVLVLFLVGFAAFVARELRGLLDATGVTRSALYWSALGVGLAAGVVLGMAAGWAAARART